MVVLLDARVLRNKKTGALFVGYPTQGMKDALRETSFVPIFQLSKNLQQRVSQAVLEAFEGPLGVEWLQQASGARALINQTNTRIAFDRSRKAAHTDSSLVMKFFVKMKGESGPVYIERVCDPQGDPIGYRRIVGLELLGNAEQQIAFTKLPEQFTFKEARQTYGRSDDPTSKWLKKCEAAGLIERLEKRGYYKKVRAARG